jgi:hypothetical protein
MAAKDIITRLLAIDPKKRMTLDEFLDTHFIRVRPPTVSLDGLYCIVSN